MKCFVAKDMEKFADCPDLEEGTVIGVYETLGEASDRCIDCINRFSSRVPYHIEYDGVLLCVLRYVESECDDRMGRILVEFPGGKPGISDAWIDHASPEALRSALREQVAQCGRLRALRLSLTASIGSWISWARELGERVGVVDPPYDPEALRAKLVERIDRLHHLAISRP